ncbi:DUF3891 family protein [Phormidium tenue FACHB-886]|nr:DUF3891 family protein [Phormidium tenue FACHB-886]
MIVNLLENGWEVIYHRAHALLAAQIGGHWDRQNVPKRFYETLAAISHHDDLEREWEGNQITEAGAPLDFTLIQDTSVAQLEEQIESSRYRGRWVTLLTSKHISFLNEGNSDPKPTLKKFLQKQTELQAKLQKELETTPEETERAYQFMRWCDRTSLILAQRQIPDVGRALEITSGIDGQRYDIHQVGQGKEHVTVEPWPFESDKFTVNVEACHLSELKYESNEALIKALKEAPIRILEWTFVKEG